MNEDEKRLMAKYGIRCEPVMTYFYKQHRYEHLKDAIHYAEIDTRHDKENNQGTVIEK